MISNMTRSIEFYTSILGMKLLKRYGDHYAEIQAPDLLIGLHPKPNKLLVGNNMSIGLGVIEFDSTIESLRKSGIKFKTEQDGWIRLAHFEDPDNNILFLAEREE
jgi:predicted enzyme related to lactoylglutathione lyase